VDATRVITRHVLPHPRYAKRVFEQARARGAIAKWRLRRKPKAIERRDERMDKERPLCRQGLFARNDAEWISHLDGRRPENKYSAPRRADIEAPAHSLERPQPHGLH
jgi:hypothetical protein